MEKFLLFTTGGGSADPLNWSSDEAALYSVSELKGIKPASSRSIDLFFDTIRGEEIVTLGIKNSTHSACMASIVSALNSNQRLITVADVDSAKFCSPYIYSVKITSQETYVQKITGNTKTKINTPKGSYSSCLITNTDASADVTVKLYLASQVGSDITDTGTNANESDNAATTSSVTLTVDGTTATSDVFLNEQVWKSDGTLFGTCTAFNSGTEIVFGNGIEQILANNADLHVGTRYTLFNNLAIPANVTLKLESDEISFDNVNYDLYVVSGDADGQLTFTFNL